MMQPDISEPSANSFHVDTIRAELDAIAKWWRENAPDDTPHGFWGEISNKGKVNRGAEQGVILCARILWFFSEYAFFGGGEESRKFADRAWINLRDHFRDRRFGGLVWSIRGPGDPVSLKKQTYAQAFGIYSCSSYYKLTGNKEAAALADDLFDCVEARCSDPLFGGYFEAFGRDWSQIGDVRLSEMDANAPKSMNTHLHILEAYTTYYQVFRTEAGRKALHEIIDLFLRHIVDCERGHLRQFFDNSWCDQSHEASHGHDIEASWLLWEAASVLGDAELMDRIRPATMKLAATCLERGFHTDGYVINETTFAQDKDETSIWWVQAEALVGFLNAYNLSGNNLFWNAAAAVWQFIQRQHVDPVYGEWTWVASKDPLNSARPYKAGMWKGPYHNGRAMMEVIRLLKETAEGKENFLTEKVLVE